MAEKNDAETKKPAETTTRRRLELKKTVETGQVRQSFSHGRSKTVTVEVKRRRSFGTPAETPAPAVAEPPVGQTNESLLTNKERASRARALQDSFKGEEQRRAEASEHAKHLEESARRRAEEDARRQAEEEIRRRTEEEARRLLEEIPVVKATEGRAVRVAPEPVTSNDDDARDKKGVKTDAKKTRLGLAKGEERRRTGKLTVTQALDSETAEERVRSLASVRRARERERQRQLAAGPREKQVRDVVVPETITVQDLANRMAERGADVIKSLMKMGVMATINQLIDADTAELIITEFGHKIKRVSDADVEIGLTGVEDETGDTVPRAPVVTVMGHVDHGKTSLLDALRSTDVVQHEAGGITQHIGAYSVTLASKQKITFIDTPGHAAFTEMRARGATATDIVILVVAADDGVKPQTVEAIAHAKAAKVPIIIAINKCDKPDANPDRVRNELLQHEIVVEKMGGDVQDVEISAAKRTGLAKLEEAILLQAEILELRANPNRPGQGVVIEAKLDKGRGAVATVLVQRGTIRVGDIFVAGAEWGKVRALVDDRSHSIKSAGPAMPVEVLGLGGVPMAGDDFIVVETEARAREVTDFRQRDRRTKQATAGARGTVEQMFTAIAAGEARELPIVIKADVQGSIEALIGALMKMSTPEVRVRVLHGAVGGINESDITLAAATQGLVIGFNVRANPQARALAKRDGVDIRYYSIIYNAIDDVKAMLSGLLAPQHRENLLGNASILEVFNITKVGKVAGCRVVEGVVKRGAKVRLLRDNVVIHEGTLKTLKRFKDEVREVREGNECGMAFENYTDIQAGDTIECFEVEQVTRTL